MSLLQSGSWEELVLLGEIPGSLKKEHEIQRRFSHLRIRGEWFHPGQELLDYIQSNIDEVKNVIGYLGNGVYEFLFYTPITLSRQALLKVGNRPIEPLVAKDQKALLGIRGKKEDILGWWRDEGASEAQLKEMANHFGE